MAGLKKMIQELLRCIHRAFIFPNTSVFSVTCSEHFTLYIYTYVLEVMGALSY